MVCSDRKASESVADSHIKVNKQWLIDYIESEEMPDPASYGFGLEGQLFYVFDAAN